MEGKMAEWLQNVVQEVNRQFNTLPEWKKIGANEGLVTRADEERPQPAITEPNND